MFAQDYCTIKVKFNPANICLVTLINSTTNEAQRTTLALVLSPTFNIIHPSSQAFFSHWVKMSDFAQTVLRSSINSTEGERGSKSSAKIAKLVKV